MLFPCVTAGTLKWALQINDGTISDIDIMIKPQGITDEGAA
ncbi:hypothetical protein AEYBE204_10010 [Asticcacaulis sp. YBE204]|nr:hypothetical protein AEYBE204_10010 [Asticcacaulis sp. YBE204]